MLTTQHSHRQQVKGPERSLAALEEPGWSTASSSVSPATKKTLMYGSQLVRKLEHITYLEMVKGRFFSETSKRSMLTSHSKDKNNQIYQKIYQRTAIKTCQGTDLGGI